MVFMQSKTDCKDAALHLRRMLPEHHQDKVCWFTADKTDAYKDSRMKRFTEGSVWGMFCTDAAGLGLDVNDIRICIQWGIEGLTFEGLYQRFGRGGRNRSLQGMGLLFVEDKFYPKTGGKRKRTLADGSDDESDSEEPVEKRPCIEQSQVTSVYCFHSCMCTNVVYYRILLPPCRTSVPLRYYLRTRVQSHAAAPIPLYSSLLASCPRARAPAVTTHAVS
ncbi:hypothetical protein EXIGLDRAFT_625190 [Exidia glandulosa HHB12029]|uniref:Helicase C-terminal domain-containing protein n=1 Tax=Exidia glandulosa HHB12029 TaxID=1314781 RepID=A0A165D4T3_EXIGL|nr:hypothetical protein EXIGLDRAFT_625190 [Exidia glandulosa HHB12029]